MDMNEGDLVTIISPCQTMNMDGIIQKIGNPYNNGYEYATLYIPQINTIRTYNVRSIKLKEKRGENNMNESLKDCKQVVGVKFLQGVNTTKEYSFASYEDEIKNGDLVLCDTNMGFGIAKVINVYDKESVTTNVTKEIITVINISSFDERQALRKRKNELKQKMDKRVKELNNVAIYEAMAAKDSDMAQMLEEYKTLL